MPRERRDGRRDVRPEERAQRVAPPRCLAEELVEARLLVGRVAAPLRLDADLAAQRDGVHRGARRLGDPHPQHDRRHRRVRLRAGVEHLERQGGHRALARTRVEEGVERVVRLAPAVEALPQPAEVADELVARVDRHEEALRSPAVAVGADEEGLDVGRQRGERRVGGDDLVPRVEREQRLGRAGRARDRTPRPARASSSRRRTRRSPGSAGCPTARATAGSP